MFLEFHTIAKYEPKFNGCIIAEGEHPSNLGERVLKIIFLASEPAILC